MKARKGELNAKCKCKQVKSIETYVKLKIFKNKVKHQKKKMKLCTKMMRERYDE